MRHGLSKKTKWHAQEACPEKKFGHIKVQEKKRE
jgi:hypothetical protein